MYTDNQYTVNNDSQSLFSGEIVAEMRTMGFFRERWDMAKIDRTAYST